MLGGNKIFLAFFPTLLDDPVIGLCMAVFSNLPAVRVGVNPILLLVVDVEIRFVDVFKSSLFNLRRVAEDQGRFRFEFWPAIFGLLFFKLGEKY